MTAPIVYKSTDANAPVVATDAVSLVNTFKKCLVDGYGDKPPAGWTMPYVDALNTKAVFASDPTKGRGFMLRVDSSGSDVRYSTFQAAEMFTGLDVWTGSFGSFGNAFISQNDTGIVRPWILVATPTWVYFWCWSWTSGTAIPSRSAALSGNGRVLTSLFFGDFVSYYPDDAYNSLFWWGQIYNSGSSFGMLNGTDAATASYRYAARALTGAAGAQAPATYGAPPLLVASNGGWSGYCKAISGTDGMLVSKIFVNNGVRGTIRGHLPRLLAVGNITDVANGSEVTVAGVPYLCVHWCAYYTSAGAEAYLATALIDLSEDPA